MGEIIPFDSAKPDLKCSFCGKPSKRVIGEDTGARICFECVEKCNVLLAEEDSKHD